MKLMGAFIRRYEETSQRRWDGSFSRREYDAAGITQAFTTRLTSEIDLEPHASRPTCWPWWSEPCGPHRSTCASDRLIDGWSAATTIPNQNPDVSELSAEPPEETREFLAQITRGTIAPERAEACLRSRTPRRTPRLPAAAATVMRCQSRAVSRCLAPIMPPGAPNLRIATRAVPRLWITLW